MRVSRIAEIELIATLKFRRHNKVESNLSIAVPGKSVRYYQVSAFYRFSLFCDLDWKYQWIILFMVMLVWYFGWKKHSRK